MENSLALNNDDETYKERVHIFFTKRYMPPPMDREFYPPPHTDTYDLTYVIPRISFYILSFSAVNIKQLEYFYANFQNLDTSRELKLYYYIKEFVIHPLLPAIKANKKHLYLTILNTKFKLSEFEHYHIRIMNEYYNIDRGSGKDLYREQIMPYIPTRSEVMQAAKEIRILNKVVLKSAVDCLARFKLPVKLTDMIVGFLKLDEIIFNTMEVAVLRALVLKQKVNNQNIAHSILSDTGGVYCGVKDLLSYKELEKIQQQSVKDAEKQGIIGPREIPDFILQDVEGLGNCFYLAISDQMALLGHNFIHNVPEGTDWNDSLRLAVQGTNFQDREWADDAVFEQFVSIFPDVILAIIDTRNPTAGFICYYIDDSGSVITNTGAVSDLNLPSDRMVLRLAATGNHFLLVRAHPSLERGAITQAWHQNINNDLEIVEDVVSNDSNSDLVVKAVFAINYRNQLFNHAEFTEIFKLIKEKGGAVAITELMNLHIYEASELSRTESVEEIANKVIEQNFFLNNVKGKDFIQVIANNFDEPTLITILEFGRDQDVAEQIVYEAEIQGIYKVIYTLLGKEWPLNEAADNLKNIIGQEELNQLRIVPNGIFNSWSNKAYYKAVEYIDSLAKNLDDMFNMGKSGNQVAVTLALLEEWLEFAASGQKFVGGRPPYYNPDDNDDWFGGGRGSIVMAIINVSAGNIDNQHGFVGLILPSYNNTDYNDETYQK